MTTTEPAPAPDDGFVHLGAAPQDADDLVAAVLPELLAARERGDRVVTVLDRPTGRRLQESLGAVLGVDDASDQIDALVPSEVHANGPEYLLGTVRGLLGPSVRALLLIQLPAGSDAAAVDERERAFDEVFAAQPVTLVCATPGGTCGDLVTVVCRRHTHLLERSGRRAAPARPSQTDPGIDGETDAETDAETRTLRAAVRGPGDLRGVRESVARMAGGVGLDTDETAAAVLAVHEAALLATGTAGSERAGRGPVGELPEGTACVVEVRAEGAGLVTEVTGPAAGPEPSLRVVRLFAADAEVRDAMHDGVAVRAVRVRSASA